MRRSTINYLVDLLLLLAMLGMLWTGVVIRFVLPAGSGRHALLLWGKGRHEWGDVHYQLVFVTIGLVVLHVGLHWDWVCDVTGRLFVRGERVRTLPEAEALEAIIRMVTEWPRP